MTEYTRWLRSFKKLYGQDKEPTPKEAWVAAIKLMSAVKPLTPTYDPFLDFQPDIETRVSKKLRLGL